MLIPILQILGVFLFVFYGFANIFVLLNKLSFSLKDVVLMSIGVCLIIGKYFF